KFKSSNSIFSVSSGIFSLFNSVFSLSLILILSDSFKRISYFNLSSSRLTFRISFVVDRPVLKFLIFHLKRKR
ncbi:MAG: hypothetical protein ABDH49_05375, partial [Candidatus Hydrothermales bacterium]